MRFCIAITWIFGVVGGYYFMFTMFGYYLGSFIGLILLLCISATCQSAGEMESQRRAERKRSAIRIAEWNEQRRIEREMAHATGSSPPEPN